MYRRSSRTGPPWNGLSVSCRTTSAQQRSTSLINARSVALTKRHSEPGLVFWQSVIRASARAALRPTMYTRSLEPTSAKVVANAFAMYAPIPVVPPGSAATKGGPLGSSETAAWMAARLGIAIGS